MKQRILGLAQRFASIVLQPIILPLQQEVRRSQRTFPRNPLNECGERFFSQNDEDGILLEIIRRIDLKPSVFLEFGVGNGTQCNTIILLAHGWRGGWVGGPPLAFNAKGRLAFVQAWVTKDNAADLAVKSINTTLSDVRVASIDLDGNDTEVLRALMARGLNPDVLVVEYNAKFPPTAEFEMPYRADHNWNGSDFQGASLLSWAKMLPGYRLVACNEAGINAFFVKNEHAAKFADVTDDICKLYRPTSFRIWPQSGHWTDKKTVEYLASRELPASTQSRRPRMNVVGSVVDGR
jgi:hypothetical protein